MKANINEIIHFSIDDVSTCFKRIQEEQFNSIFDEPMLSKLKQWHNDFGLNVDCYVFEEKDDFNISELEDVYWEELKKNSGWLRLCWHQVSPYYNKVKTEEQISSIERVCKLILKKCSSNGLSRSVRLHMFEGNSQIINCLSKFGIRTFLTADSKDRISYDLMNEQNDVVWKTGGYYNEEKENYYKRTDLRMDLLTDGYTLEQMLDMAHECVNRQPGKRSLEIFCHEWKFHEINAEIEFFLSRIRDVKKTIYLDAAQIHKNYIYFTDTFSSLLYQLDVGTGAINVLADLPIAESGIKFASVLLYKSTLWMVPHETGKVLAYDVKEKRVLELILPQDSSNVGNKMKCRKAVVYKNYLWILPHTGKAILCLDMDTYRMKIVDEFPKEVSFDTNKEMMFRNMDLYNGTVYLFSDSCSHNLKIDAVSGNISIWNSDFNGTFGVMMDSGIAILPPIKADMPIRIYYEENRLFDEIAVPDWIWGETEIYAFWYSFRTKEYIYCLPHEAKGIIRYSYKDRRFDFIKTDKNNYSTIRNNLEFAGYEVLESDEHTWIVSYRGNQILKIGKDGKISGVCKIELNLGQFYETSHIKNKIIYEEDSFKLDDYIGELVDTRYERKEIEKE